MGILFDKSLQAPSKFFVEKLLLNGLRAFDTAHENNLRSNTTMRAQFSVIGRKSR